MCSPLEGGHAVGLGRPGWRRGMNKGGGRPWVEGQRHPAPGQTLDGGRGSLHLTFSLGPSLEKRPGRKSGAPAWDACSRAKDLGVSTCGRAGSPGHPRGPRQDLCILWAAEVVRCSWKSRAWPRQTHRDLKSGGPSWKYSALRCTFPLGAERGCLDGGAGHLVTGIQGQTEYRTGSGTGQPPAGVARTIHLLHLGNWHGAQVYEKCHSIFS